ncbi:MAG: hypothetical protein ACFCUT_03750 [Kiloniellaceae bacterium]
MSDLETADASENHAPRKWLGYLLIIAGFAWLGLEAWLVFSTEPDSYRRQFPTAWDDFYMMALFAFPSVMLFWLGFTKLRPSKPKPEQQSARPAFPWGAFLLLALYWIGSVAVFGFLAVLAYGVAVAVFRAAFGIELPDPFNW